MATLSASDNSNFTDNVLSGTDDLKNDDAIVVEPDKENPNQIVKPTIQPAMDEANSGDTLILNGSFTHCHFLINKTLNIISNPKSSINSCPHYQTEDAGSYGVFYVTEGADGSVFNGITFRNNARAQSPFAFLIRGVSDITISNCNVNYDETDEFKFQGIVIENSNGIKLYNLTNPPHDEARDLLPRFIGDGALHMPDHLSAADRRQPQDPSQPDRHRSSASCTGSSHSSQGTPV